MARNISTRPSCYSREKIEYRYEHPIDIQVVLHNGLTSVLPYVNGSYEVMSDSVSVTSCCPSCLSPWSLNDRRENCLMFENVKLFTMNDILMCTGEFLQCVLSMQDNLLGKDVKSWNKCFTCRRCCI